MLANNVCPSGSAAGATPASDFTSATRGIVAPVNMFPYVSRRTQPATADRHRAASAASTPPASRRIASAAVYPSSWSDAFERDTARPRTKSVIRRSCTTGRYAFATESNRIWRFGSVTSHGDPARRASNFPIPLSRTCPYVPV
jgi:hypothetical protein